MPVERFSSGVPWESEVGYSRAVRAGPFVILSGTTATTPDGVVLGGADLYVQTKSALAHLATALERADARLEDVVQTRIYVTDIARWRDAGRAHAEVFHSIRPAATMVEVAALIDPRLLVEIEALAYVGG